MGKESKELSIREATLDDASAIKYLVMSLSRYYLEDEGSLLPIWFLRTLDLVEFKERIQSEEYRNLVCIKDDKIIGYIALKDDSHLYHLFVTSDHQGQGISKKLWQSAISELPTQVYTVSSTVYAIPIYRSFGFRESEPLSNSDGMRFQPMSFSR